MTQPEEKEGRMSLNVSVLILAKNEEKNIEACIRSASFAGEVLVIDDSAQIGRQNWPEALVHVF